MRIPGDLALRSDSGPVDSGEGTVPRIFSAPLPSAWTSQSLRLTYFTARKGDTINNVILQTGSVAAGATPTLCRVGIYSIDASGNLTLTASTANDTTLFAAAGGLNTKALSSAFTKVAGTRYAFGILIVSSATIPTFTGLSIASNESRLSPPLTGAVSGQADLPSTVAVGSIANSGSMVHALLTP